MHPFDVTVHKYLFAAKHLQFPCKLNVEDNQVSAREFKSPCIDSLSYEYHNITCLDLLCN